MLGLTTLAKRIFGSSNDRILKPYYAKIPRINALEPDFAKLTDDGKKHPLTRKAALALDDLADLPIITYQPGFTGRARIDEAFDKAGLVPRIAMTALDADVLKTYVEIGLGIGIIASMAFSKEHDPTLALLDASHLFARCTSLIAIRRGAYLRRYACRFIELCVPSLTEATIRQAGDSAE